MAIRLGPLVFFLPTVDDQEYAPLFNGALGALLPVHRLLRMSGIDLSAVEPERVHETELPIVRAHLMTTQGIHNRLTNIRPRGRLFHLHKAVIKVVKTHAYTLADYGDSCVAMVQGDISLYNHHKRDGATWDALACRYLKELRRTWERLPPAERERVARMVGSADFPQDLELVADICASTVPSDPLWVGNFGLWT